MLSSVTIDCQITVIIVLRLIGSCLLITLIKCLKGHKSLELLQLLVSCFKIFSCLSYVLKSKVTALSEEWGSCWQGHLLNCCGPLKSTTYLKVTLINHFIKTAWYCGQYFKLLLSAIGTAHIFQSIAILGCFWKKRKTFLTGLKRNLNIASDDNFLELFCASLCNVHIGQIWEREGDDTGIRCGGRKFPTLWWKYPLLCNAMQCTWLLYPPCVAGAWN